MSRMKQLDFDVKLKGFIQLNLYLKYLGVKIDETYE